MKRNKLVSTGIAFLLAGAGVLTLGACSDDAGPSDAEPPAAVESPADAEAPGAAEESDVAEDLEAAREAILEGIASEGNWEQIMLADDISAPEVKYGMLVMPFFMSDAGSRVTRTVNIEDGDFTITVTSAATGIEWEINQDGTISQVG